MKTNHNQLRTMLFAVTVLVLLASGLAHADNIYVPTGNTIVKFDSVGNMSTFASGLNYPRCIAVQVPEPATLLLFGLGAVVLRRKRS